MNTDMDNLIRDAVRRQEELAVDPNRIRAALPARTMRRRRTRTLATVAAAVMAVVAVLVPVIAVPDPGNGPGPAVFAAPGPTTFPMYYRPTWLPDGMIEEFRSVPLAPDAEPGMARGWKSSSADSPSWHIALLAVPGEPPGEDTPGTDVEINGRPGYYNEGTSQATLTWQADENTTLYLTTTTPEISEEVMVQIARSVKPDPTRLRPPMNLGWFPHTLDEGPTLQVSRRWPAEWMATIEIADAERFLSVSIGAPKEPVRGETVTINGRTAHLAKGLLTMDVGDGRQLVVRGTLTRDEIIRVTENIQLDPHPDVAWLGR